MTAKLIALEGVDGVGKQTQALLLRNSLRERGLASEVISFPQYGLTAGARIVTSYLTGQQELNTEELAFAYAMDRFEGKPRLAAMRARNDVVICDRYSYSNIAYQSARRSPSLSASRRYYELEFSYAAMPRVDLAIHLAVGGAWEPLESRLKARGDRDANERDTAFLRRVETTYRRIAEAFPRDWASVPAMEGSPEEIHENVLAHVLRCIGEEPATSTT